MKQLEETFGCPVIESYGMTEASHQMASNPLPPRPRKPGSVGIAAGPEVAIMDPDGKLLARRRDRRDRDPRRERDSRLYQQSRRRTPRPSPTAGSAPAIRACWTRMGISVSPGRLKEIINRGGEKIAPREVDDVLMEHPAVAQVVTFAMPHENLGEEVAAAVVLRDGQSATEQELRSFAAVRLAGLQGAAQDRVPAGDPERRHRQTATHRPRATTGTVGVSERRSRPPLHSSSSCLARGATSLHAASQSCLTKLVDGRAKAVGAGRHTSAAHDGGVGGEGVS